MRIIDRKIVGALIVSKDNKVFLVKNSNLNVGVYSGYWLVPGGGIEEGETREEAVLREAKEETGLDLSKYKIKLVAHNRKGSSEKVLKTGETVLVNMTFDDFLIVIEDKNSNEIEIMISDEHTDYGWFGVEELKVLKLSPPTQELLVEAGYL